MKKIFLVLLLGTAMVFSASCRRAEIESANSNVNVNVAEQPKNEVLAYTDAATALADGNKFFDENLTEKAIDAYKQAVKLNPDLAEAHFKLGIAYASLESEQELIETPAETGNLEKTDKSKKDKKEKKSNSVLAFENAETAYKKILKENPDDDVAQFNLGRTYDRLNEDTDARKAFEAAVKLKPEEIPYQTELGAILIKLAQYDEAVRALKKAVELDEGNAQAQELLDKAEAGKSRVDDGAKKLQDALKPSDAPKTTGKSNRKNDSKENSNTSDVPEKKDTEKKKETPKPTPNQIRKPS